MKRLFFIFTCFYAAIGIFAQAGIDCENAIRVVPGATYNISMRDTWFTATTKDLPLTIAYFPDPKYIDEKPKVWLDLSCDGVYDSIGQIIVDKAKKYHQEFPNQMVSFKLEQAEDEQKYYKLYYGANLSQILGVVGLDSTTNITAYVHLQILHPGKTTISSDSTGMMVPVPDTTTICPPDTREIKYSMRDSIKSSTLYTYHYHIEDTTKNVYMLWIANNNKNAYLRSNISCDFTQGELETTTLFSDLCIPLFDKELLKTLYEYGIEDLYYKLTTIDDGFLLVEDHYIDPSALCENVGSRLDIGSKVQLNLNRKDTILYQIPIRDWRAQNIGMHWSGNKPIKAYLVRRCEDKEHSIVDSLSFSRPMGNEKQYYLYLSESYTDKLSIKTNKSTMYLYFIGDETGTLSIDLYEPNCFTRGRILDVSSMNNISENVFAQVFKFYLPDWQKKDIEVRWDGPSTLEFFVADTCDFLLQSTNTHLLAEGYHQLAPSQSFIITQGVAKGWAERVGDFAYARLLNGAQGTLTLTIIKDYNDDTPIVKQQYQLTLTAEPRDAGIFSINDGMTEQSYTNDILIDENTNIKITAIADEHYSFRSWSDGNAQNPRSVNMNTDKQYTALFAANKYTITVSPSDATMGRVSGSGRYSYLASVNIEARANRGYRFEYWLTDGGEQGTLIDNPMSIIVEGDRKYEAVFVDENTATDNVRTDTDQPHKIIRNNEILILMPDGRTFNLLGQETK